MSRIITKSHFKKEVLESGQLSLVHFKTEWSGACHIIHPAFEELSRSYTGVADFFSVDVDQEAGIAAAFGVQEYPTILFFQNGQLVDHAVGLIPKNTLITKIENALALIGKNL